MRSRSREINTLNLSMLDIIAGAMAAFLILMVILLPYYERETVNQEEIMAELRQAVAEVGRLRRVAEELAKQVKSVIRPNLVLYIE